jgi:hypothetical protein
MNATAARVPSRAAVVNGIALTSGASNSRIFVRELACPRTSTRRVTMPGGSANWTRAHEDGGRRMIRDVADRNVMGRYVTAVRAELAAGAVDDDAAKAAGTIRPDADAEPKDEILRHLPDDGAGPDEDGPFLAHDPIVSLMQTSIDERLREDAVVEPEDPEGDGFFERVLDRLHPERYGPDDPRWITKIAKATLKRLAEGNHPFNPEPAEYAIADDARLVVVGDWGTGLERAQHVARHMADAVTEATAQGRETHVVHLGDVYYSGVPDEYDRHVLADGWWPVTAAQSEQGVASWSLMGNHDMYSGGWGFFDHLLADPRFARQRDRKNGEPTSWFRLTSPSWTIAGLDTSWNPDVVDKGTRGVLEDPQATRLQQWAAEPGGGKLMLLSHHQYVTIDDTRGIGEDLRAKVAPMAGSRRVTAWLWGHEHRCIGYATAEIAHMRCIGHGGVPVPSRPPRDVLPPPAVWEVTGSYEADGQRWGRFGFAVLDFAGGRIDVTYRDDAGAETHRETIS